MRPASIEYFGPQDPRPRDTRPALLVIDLTRSCASEGDGWIRFHRRRGATAIADYYLARLQNQVLPNTRSLIESFRNREWPVVYAVYGPRRADLADLPVRARLQDQRWTQQGLPSPYRQVPSTRREVLPELAPRGGDLVVRKVLYSVFRGSRLHRRLEAVGVNTLVFVGVGTNYCVMLSLLEAYDLGYRCALVSDATATLSEDEQVVAERFVEPYAAILDTADMSRWLEASTDGALPVREGVG